MSGYFSTSDIWGYWLPLAAAVLGVIGDVITNDVQYAAVGGILALVVHIIATVESAGPPPAAQVKAA